MPPDDRSLTHTDADGAVTRPWAMRRRSQGGTGRRRVLELAAYSYVCLAVMLFTYRASGPGYGEVSAQMTTFLGLAAIVAPLVVILARHGFDVPVDQVKFGVFWLYLAVVAWMFASQLWGSEGSFRPALQIFLVSTGLFVLFTFVLVRTGTTGAVVAQIARTTAVIGILAALVAFVSYLWGPFELAGLRIADPHTHEFRRASGWFSSGNRLATVLGLGAISSLFLLMREEAGKLRVLMGSLGLAIITCGLLLAGARMVWTGLLVVAVVMLLARGRVTPIGNLGGVRLRDRLVLGLGTAVLSAWVAVSASGGTAAVARRLEDPESLATASGRTWIWSAVWDALAHSSAMELVVGQGFRFSSELLGTHAHNLYLGHTLEHGLIWLGLFAALTLAMWRVLWQWAQVEPLWGRYIIACFCLILANGLSTSTLFAYRFEAVFFALLAAWAATVSVRQRAESR